MDKNDLLIVIVEDDTSFAKALKTAIEQTGYQVKTFSTANDCIQQYKINPPDLLIVDCLLPGMPGVEMLLKIYEEDTKTPAILMSGIFTDKSFIKDALTKTNALGFLSKPFDIKVIIEKIDSILLEKTGINTPPLEQIYHKSSLSPKETIQLLSQLETVSGLHLPKLIMSILKSSENIHLELKDEDTQKVSSVAFYHGKIVEVKVDDPNSYFGRLIVEKGFVSPEELETVLNKPSQKRIGEKLIDENLISPHMINIINFEQMCLRLGRLIKDTSYIIKILPSNNNLKSDVDAEFLTKYIADWVRSKYELSWLHKFYSPWLNSAFIIERLQKSLSDLVSQHLNDSAYAKIISLYTAGSSIQELLDAHPNEEEKVFFLSHMMASINAIYFDQNINTKEQSLKLERVKHLLEAAEKQDYFQVLGINRRAKVSDVKKTFHDLAKTFHPDKLPKSTPPDVVAVTKEFFSKLTLAYETLSDTAKKEVYIKELETGQAALRLRAESLFEEAKEIIAQRQYTKAKDKLNEAISLCPPTSELKLHMLWVDLALIGQTQDAKALTRISEDLNRVPPEDRHNATYYFVKGLLQKSLGQNDLAKGNFAHAVSIQPDFVEAKREFNILSIEEKNRPIDLLNADLKDVVGSLFKKK